MGGIGLGGSSGRWSLDPDMSAGDAYECCGRKARRGNRPWAVQLFGRYSWQNGDIQSGHLGSKASPAQGCEELSKICESPHLLSLSAIFTHTTLLHIHCHKYCLQYFIATDTHGVNGCRQDVQRVLYWNWSSCAPCLVRPFVLVWRLDAPTEDRFNWLDCVRVQQ